MGPHLSENRVRIPRIPKGCDQQGRYPEAAECCTDVGADDDEASIGEGAGAIVWPLVSGLVVLAVFGPLALHLWATWGAL